MFSLAIVSLSPCSAAISSRTGATILQGPHHSAQKSTSTGLSLSSTSALNDWSVTFLVLPTDSSSVMSGHRVNAVRAGRIPASDGDRRRRRGLRGLVQGGQEALGVQR